MLPVQAVSTDLRRIGEAVCSLDASTCTEVAASGHCAAVLIVIQWECIQKGDHTEHLGAAQGIIVLRSCAVGSHNQVIIVIEI